MFTIMTLNLFRYNDWENRKDNIIRLINEQKPDFLALQEVLTNHAYSNYPQSDFIAENCAYKYKVFAPTLLRTHARDKFGNKNQLASEGQACLSRFPILSSESYFLKQHAEYPEDVSVLFCLIEIEDKKIELCNVHFANNSISYKHLGELLQLLKKRQTNTIIVGDFNIYNLSSYKEKNKLLSNYLLSSEINKYISYEPDNDSLDYIAVPQLPYKIKTIKCYDTYVSDHKAVSAEVELVI